MKSILIISFSNISSDPRVQRQIKTLKNQYAVSVLGFGESTGHKDVGFIPVKPPVKRQNKFRDALNLLCRKYEKFYLQTTYVNESIKKTQGLKFDLVVANDIEALPFAINFFSESKIWFDAHEYSPKEFESSLQWRIFFQGYKTYLCKSYMNKADRLTTVCDGLAAEYTKQFNLKVEVITNASEFHLLSPSPLTRDKIRIIHHGGAIRDRKIEKMILLMDHLEDRFEFNFILMPTDPQYLRELKELSKSRRNKNIHFLEPVPFKNISEYINQFDLGLYILEPTSFNNKHALPNKIFEFIQARLGILIGPSPEMATIVTKYNLGVVTSSFDIEAIAKKVNSLSTEQILRFKQASNQHALELSFDSESKKMKELVASLMQGQ